MILPHALESTCVSEILLKNSFIKIPLLVFEILKPHLHRMVLKINQQTHESREEMLLIRDSKCRLVKPSFSLFFMTLNASFYFMMLRRRMSESNFTPYLNGMTMTTKRELKLQAMNHKTLMRVNIKKFFMILKEKKTFFYCILYFNIFFGVFKCI